MQRAKEPRAVGVSKCQNVVSLGPNVVLSLRSFHVLAELMTPLFNIHIFVVVAAAAAAAAVVAAVVVVVVVVVVDLILPMVTKRLKESVYRYTVCIVFLFCENYYLQPQSRK